MRFHLEADSLTVVFEGLEQVWALKRTLVIPKAAIVQADWSEDTLLPRRELGWRIGGTGLPGMLYAGRFASREGRNFVYLQRPKLKAGGIMLRHVLIFELRGNAYKQLLFTVDNPDIAENIIAWWSGNR